MNSIKIIAPLSSLSERTRLYKLAVFINENIQTKTITHIGWERIKGEKEEKRLKFNIEKDIILEGGGYGTSAVKKLYFFWMIKVFLKCLKYKKTDIIWALGFESAFPAMIASKFKKFKVIFDDADRFSMIYNFPKPVDKVLQYLEKKTSRNVYFHVVPSLERYNFSSKKFYLLKNTPSKSQTQIAKDLSKTLKKPSKFVININGWLGSGRGMKQALELIKKLEGKEVMFLLIGKIDCKEAKNLSKHSQVIYKGVLSNSETLANYYISDAVFTYYNPELIINQYAESNKWGDAIKTGCIILVNKEVKSAKFIKDNKLGKLISYENVNELYNTVIHLLDDPLKLKNLKENIEQYSYIMPYYEDQLIQLFKKITHE